MSTVALQEAIHWHDALMDAEFKGRKDNEGAARFRLSKKIGVPESYLFRLNYKRSEMRDVPGEVYRRLMLAYDAICTHVENKADALEREAQAIEGTDAVDQRPSPAGEGMGSAAQCAEREEA